MPRHRFLLSTLLTELQGGLLFGEALLFPEVSQLGQRPDALRKALEARVRERVRELSARELFQRLIASPPRLEERVLDVEPARRSAAWPSPLPLPVPIVRYEQGESALVAYAPSLGIEVLGRSEDELAERVTEALREALAREGATASLRKLALLAGRGGDGGADAPYPGERGRRSAARLETREIELEHESPRELDLKRRKGRGGRQDRLDALPRVAEELEETRLAPAFEVDADARRLAEALTGPARRSVLLVGPSGVGKTAILRELARRRAAFGLPGTPIWSTSGARLVAGMTGFGMWQERVEAVCREVVRARAILHVGNLVELVQVGRAEGQHESIGSFLRPRLARREVLAVAECTAEELGALEREDPALLAAFTTLRIEEPDSATTRRILVAVAGATLGRPDGPENGAAGAAILRPGETAPALDAVTRVHARYARASANPGRVLRFLGNLLQDHAAGTPLTDSAVCEAFARETGLPRFLVDPREPFDPEETTRWLSGRVAGQDEAVRLVVDVLATAAAGLARPGKPIASFLFIGPTGVGKTETARALAELLFGSRERLLRLDMSEYGDPVAVKRLVGGVFGTEGILTAKVREQPFSVILLDEIEKVHPLFFDLLLQVLGEARLTDAAGRLADFGNSVVIMTSNLGARSFGTPEVGLHARGDGGKDARAHFDAEVRSFLRPELYNRIDRIVPFLPLAEETLVAIARRHLEEVASREGSRARGLEVSISDEVARALARSAHDPAYGARPLRRALERQLLAPLAASLHRLHATSPASTSATSTPALTARVTAEGPRVSVEVRERRDARGRPLAASDTVAGARADLAEAQEIRRDLARVQRTALVFELENELERVALELRAAERHPDERRRAALRERLRPVVDELRPLVKRLRSLKSDVEEAEERLLLASRGSERPDSPCAHLRLRLKDLLVDLVSRRHAHPDQALLVVFSEHPAACVALARALWEVIPEARKLYRFEIVGRDVAHHAVAHPERFLAATPEALPGMAIEVEGRGAGIRYGPEAGLHTLVLPGSATPRACLVLAGSTMSAFDPPAHLGRRGALSGQKERRTYDLVGREIEDHFLGRRVSWSGQRLTETLAGLIEAAFWESVARLQR